MHKAAPRSLLKAFFIIKINILHFPDFMKIKQRFIKHFYIILLLLLFFTSAVAVPITGTRKITGKITDKATGLPIAGVTVSIPDLKIGTSTNTNGIYLLKQLPRGEYLIQVTAMGYASVAKLIDLSNTYSVD